MELPVNEAKTLLDGLAEKLIDALESSDREKILSAQKSFADSISVFWNVLDQSDIAPKHKSVPRLVAGWAMNELPQKIQDPANDAETKHQLSVFRKSLAMFTL
jgi:hypothetical protein